jgi:hypothetical protein
MTDKFLQEASDMNDQPERGPKPLANGQDLVKKSRHEAGFGCTPAGADRLYVARAAIRDHGDRNTETGRRRK